MKSKNVIKIFISLFLALTVITAFKFIDGLNDAALAPLLDETIEYLVPDDIYDPDALLHVAQTPLDDPYDEAYYDSYEDINNSYEDIFIDPGYVLLRMDPSDIHFGALILVNPDVVFVFPNEHQNDLIRIADYISDVFGITSDQMILSASILAPLNQMMEEFNEYTGVTNVVIRSAFRSLSGQRQIFDDMVRRWGRTGALLWAALPGHSEHHTGLAFDFGIRRGGQTEMFAGTGLYSWIPRNSHRFGFILRYPENKTSITRTNFEPWHYRYVGIPHASIMRANNWVLEEYIDWIRGYTFEEPYTFIFNDIEYTIYFTSELYVKLPYDVDFKISGNNIDGFIVTIWQDPARFDAETGGEV